MRMTPRGLIVAAALSAAMAVIAGAFGAHGAASPQAAEWLRTGGQYQLIHAVAALALALDGRWRFIGGVMLAGGLIFAGTLYVMALGGPKWLGAVTPIGGAMMIAAWAWLALSALRYPETQ